MKVMSLEAFWLSEFEAHKDGHIFFSNYKVRKILVFGEVCNKQVAMLHTQRMNIERYGEWAINSLNEHWKRGGAILFIYIGVQGRKSVNRTLSALKKPEGLTIALVACNCHDYEGYTYGGVADFLLIEDEHGEIEMAILRKI